jgi:uncharacterized protein
MSYRKLRHYIIKNLSTDLSEGLKYHGMHHTLDVVRVCNQHIARFKLNKKDAELLRIGALMHDYGFLFTYKNHEEKGIEKAREILPSYGYSAKDIEVVCGLILATKVPQSPQNDLEKLICDADLDYLGRSDFDTISQSLFEELKLNGFINDHQKWNTLQVQFLKNHEYHTDWAKKYRQPNKALRLHALMKLVGEI